MSLPRHLSLYNGVSERSRGWKMRRPEKVTEERPSNMSIMRWDGAARSSSNWDFLRRDPELWHRDGDCYVHLYGRGHSRRGPAFKVPFSALLEASCYPLLEKFATNEVSETVPSSTSVRNHAQFSRTSKQPRIELYIPAPPGSDKQQAFKYHLKTRNFFAFIFKRSLVGEYLGEALMNVFHSAQQFRTADTDNMADVMSYMDEEGYLNMKNQPTHALAVLHFAEDFRIRELYIEAFAHCCGMNDRLYLAPEYQIVSSATRKFLRRAHLEMEVKLDQMCRMLSTFLQDELSEAYLGLHSGGRAHLERFRTLLHGFYAAKLGYYPPPSTYSKITIFEVDILQRLRRDFEALYQYLVDEEFDPLQGVLPSAQGGICALQSVQAFDARCNFTNLRHPFPLLPNVRSQASSKRMAWFGKQSKLSSTQKIESHVALLKATNEINVNLLNNDLVRAYRQFEEDSIYSPIKGDKQEQLNIVDARKVRWILVYAVYQTLRQVTQAPTEVKDPVGAPYSLCISTTNLPPWVEDGLAPPLVSRKIGRATQSASVSMDSRPAGSKPQRPVISTSFEIKPDIDYLGLLQKDGEIEGGAPSPAIPGSPVQCANLKRGLSQNRAFRRSLRLFSNQETVKPPSPTKRQSQLYHEIVVLGYGNGTHAVEFTPADTESGAALTVSEISNTATTSRSTSTASSISESTVTSQSEDGSAATVDTTLTESTANSPVMQAKPDPWEFLRNRSFRVRGQTSNVQHGLPRAMSMGSNSRPSALLFYSEKSNDVSNGPIKPQRSRSLLDRYRKSLEPTPLSIRKIPLANFEHDNDNALTASDTINEDIWEDIEILTKSPTESVQTDVIWDHYNDLGGLTDFSDVRPKRRSTMF